MPISLCQVSDGNAFGLHVRDSPGHVAGAGYNEIERGVGGVLRVGPSARIGDPSGNDTGVNAGGEQSIELLGQSMDNQRFCLTAKLGGSYWASLISGEVAVFDGALT